MNILVINNGSSSLKFALFDVDKEEQITSGLVEGIGTPLGQLKGKCCSETTTISIDTPTHLKAIEALTRFLHKIGVEQEQIAAVGHRVVHGGERFSESVLIDQEVLDIIEECGPLAPLHNPVNLLGIQEAMKIWPGIPQIAVFDTAFHQSMPAKAYTYPIPRSLYNEHGVRRYGFHGTSHRYVCQKTADMLDKPVEDLAIITAHLGNGCSASAILGGQSVDTTLGLTPLEGLMMGTRSGDVDPGLFSFLNRNLGWDVAKIDNVLNRESGLLGVSGLSQDMRELKKAKSEGHEGAILALEVFTYRLAKSLAALSVALGRIDALVFTGGIGENNADLRADVLNMLTHLGFKVDSQLNAQAGSESNGIISAEGSITAMVVPTNEELLIAMDSKKIIQED